MKAEAAETLTATVNDQVRSQVDEWLTRFLDDHGAPVADPAVRGGYDLLREFVLGGGKRIRPILCYWGWRGAGGRDDEQIVAAGAALELCHVGLLIHDDIMDGSELRRGRPTLHRRLARPLPRVAAEPFGHSAAILLGVLSLAWADELLATSGVDSIRLRAAHRLFAEMRTEVIAGQYLDILAQVRQEPTIDSALTVIRYKTAKYTVERPLQIGGALAGASSSLLSSYSGFGLPLGEAFQLRDDILGVFGDPAVTGKPVIDDLREGKQTVLIGHAFADATPGQRRHLRAWHGNRDLDDDHAAELREIIKDTGALARVEDMIERRVGAALAALSGSAIRPDAAAALTFLADRLTRRTR